MRSIRLPLIVWIVAVALLAWYFADAPEPNSVAPDSEVPVSHEKPDRFGSEVREKTDYSDFLTRPSQPDFPILK